MVIIQSEIVELVDKRLFLMMYLGGQWNANQDWNSLSKEKIDTGNLALVDKVWAKIPVCGCFENDFISAPEIRDGDQV